MNEIILEILCEVSETGLLYGIVTEISIYFISTSSLSF